MFRLKSFRLTFGILFCLVAIAVGSTLHVPKVAAQGYQHFVAPMVTSTCSSTTPCLQETNSGSGPGLKGISLNGNGTVGQTKFNSTTTASDAGVLGLDSATSESAKMPNSGVLGTSVLGIGVQGRSVLGYGVYATSQSTKSALFAINTGGSSGVQAIGLYDNGTNSSTQNESTQTGFRRSGVWGHDDSTDGGQLNAGVSGSSASGFGVEASSANYVGLNVIGGGSTIAGAAVPALSLVGGNAAPGVLMMACSKPIDNPCTSSSASNVFSLDVSGNVTIAGEIRTSGPCSAGCITGKHALSHRVVSYAPTQTVPSIDDFGEAQLVNGSAYVPLSADFANVVDRHAHYLVFITPEGNSRGLFVSDKTSSGFYVRENEGGRSTLVFSYRIVAKPVGASDSRLPMESVSARAAQ